MNKYDNNSSNEGYVVLLMIIGLVLLFISLLLSCNDESIQPNEFKSIGEQYYRLKQVDFDGTETIFDMEYSNNIHNLDTITGNHIIRNGRIKQIPLLKLHVIPKESI